MANRPLAKAAAVLGRFLTLTGRIAGTLSIRTQHLSERLSCDELRWVTPLDFGASGDGKSDETTAVLAALKEAGPCMGVRFPRGHKFLVTPGSLRVTLKDTALRLEGELVGPGLDHWNRQRERWPAKSCAFGGTDGCKPGVDPEPERSRWALLHLVNSRNVTLSGGGSVWAPGASFWRVRNTEPQVKGYCLLKVEGSQGISIKDLRFVDSPMYHVVIAQSRHVRLRNLRIEVGDDQKLGEDAHNTDGISVGPASSDVKIQNCDIASGDDNLVVKAGCSRIFATGLVLRRGKGLAIGSLGERNAAGSVVDCRFENITLLESRNGVRIKTWRGGHGEVRNMTFADFHVRKVALPVLVNQLYCPRSQRPGGCDNEAEHIQISSVLFQRFDGSFSGRAERNITCHAGCGVAFSDMRLRRAVP
mmetsp:Transcript_46524/g.132671  ORF Transcript_46524/g.132671 Transcript_46524/m.132671 type:complete len:418 (-) Transcript_46524:68-1321(-)